MKLSFLNHINKAQHLLCFFLICLAPVGHLYSQNSELDSLLSHLKKSNTDTDRVYTLDHLYGKFVLSDPEKARDYAEQCLELSKKINFKEGIAIGKGNLGISFMMREEYKEATVYFLDAISILEKLGDYSRMARFYGNIANINLKMNELNKALEYNSKAIQLKGKSGDDKSFSFNYQLNAYIYYMQKDMDKALHQYNIALKEALNHNEKNILPTLYNGYATVYMTTNKFDQAIVMYNKAITALQDIGGNKKWETGILHNLGRLYYAKKEYKQAIKHINKSLEIAKEINSKEDIKQAYSSLDKAYYDAGEIQNAYDALSWYSIYKDSVLNENTQNEINALQEQFDSERKQNEINLLKQEKEKLTAQSAKQKILLISSISVSILILLILLLFVKQRKIKALKEKAELEQKALRAQMNPHFIFNSLNSIHRMFMEGDYDVANDYISDFGELLRTILENSGKSVITINDEINTIKLYLEIEKMRTEGMIEYNLNVDPTIDLYNSFVPPLIIQPFVENAIWHGILPTEKKGTITIDIARRDKNTLICTITDNGIGIEQSKKQKKTEDHKSKGMKITEDRLNIVNSVKAEELPTGGTKVTILIPVS